MLKRNCLRVTSEFPTNEVSKLCTGVVLILFLSPSILTTTKCQSNRQKTVLGIIPDIYSKFDTNEIKSTFLIKRLTRIKKKSKQKRFRSLQQQYPNVILVHAHLYLYHAVENSPI